uniref:receptor-like protein EIX2 n=1 Tax=Erigeron canadensis TaxID=72917 RepID=UPI001CB9B698|nr:receptor-like protein EIX2 [Erigeron canadensis]
MKTNICLRFVLFILSHGLLCLKTATATSVGHELVARDGVINKKCVDNERDALLDFKTLLDDPNDFLSTWKAEEDECCKWSGVMCNNQTGHVIKLYLRHGGLGGKVSPSLGNLTYLNHLDLSDNYFQGTIPISIGCMTKLRYLDLSLNSFDRTIPPEFGNLANLQELALGSLGKQCTIETTVWLSNLSHLHHLDMNGISLARADYWVNVILSLPKLSYLSLRGCDLSRVIHPYSSSLFVNSSSSIATLLLESNNLNSSMYDWLFLLTGNQLVELDLSRNKLDEIPKFLGNLCSLTILDFTNNSAVLKFSELLDNLSGCTSVTLQALYAEDNQIMGSLSDKIQMFSSLRYLYLPHNRLNGTISEKVWELPWLEQLDVSSNSFRGSISQNVRNSKLQGINLSNNSLEVVHLSNFPYVKDLDLRSCKLGPWFPKWIHTLKSLTRILISNNGISDTIPMEFWNTWPSQLSYLDLSFNNISGKVPDLLSNFDHHSTVDLSSNSFFGPISNVPSTLEVLDLSRNNFHGGISFLCQIVDGFLTFLDLSHNSFTGPIPDCLWHFKQLMFLNLGNNYLSGKLPASVGSLTGLYMLNLCNNSLSGELPLALRQCTKLTFLDLGANRFSGNVPVWIGENLSRLYVICLTSNELSGPIPFQLCQLENLQILDLSMNNLNGTIPSCVNNLTSMVQQRFSLYQNRLFFSWASQSIGERTYGRYNQYVGHAMIKWQGNVREFSKTLGFVKSIDLSSNNLTGKIPNELSNLQQLLQLNLSTNALQGEIPRKIGQMKELLTLDLSNNNLLGVLPSSMALMTSLNYLDVSHNNLSGRIPLSTQLQSFESSRYMPNAGLCGPPVTKRCPGDEASQVSSSVCGSMGDGESNSEFWRWFYIGGGIGFATGFWIVCGTLLFNRRLRHSLCHFLDRLSNWTNVKFRLIVARLQ